MLDSIFKNQPPEQEAKKYDKAFFESCNFWEMPTDDPQTNSKNSPTPSKGKQSPENKFATGGFVIQADNFDKMFQTGLKLHETKPKEKDREREKEKDK